MEARLQPIDLKDISIRDEFWDRYTRLVPEKMLPYQWRALNDQVSDAEPSHCIENLRIAAGEAQGHFHGFVFQDTDVAKWLEAAAYTLAWRPDPELEALADQAIELIGRAQEPDGYLDTYFTIEAPDSRFRNLRYGHELYTAGHMIEAAVAYYQVTGKRAFLDIMCRTADLICQVFRSEEFRSAYPGHEEIELALIRLYAVTGRRDYLDMAKQFVDRRGVDPDYFQHEPEHPAWIPFFGQTRDEPVDKLYHQCHMPVRRQTAAEGHAVRAVYLYSAMADLAWEYRDETLTAACERLYENIVRRRMYITGGIGSSGYFERFTTDFDLPNDSAYAESCASIGLAMFCRRMLQNSRDSRYADTMERALMNTVTAGVSLSGDAFFYVNPLAVWPASCMENTSMSHVKPVRQKWFGCACCPPNIARTFASLGQYAVMTCPEGIWLNLFFSGTFSAHIGGTKVAVSCQTDFPFAGEITLKVHAASPVSGTLALRLPDYATEPVLLRNSQSVCPRLEKGYLCLDGVWDRDEIVYRFAMPARFVWSDPRLRADVGRAAVMKGPLVYCLEQIDNGADLAALSVDTAAGLTEGYDPSLLGGTAVIRAKGRRTVPGTDGPLYRGAPPAEEPAELTYVPYCFWGNREPGEMQVWTRTCS